MKPISVVIPASGTIDVPIDQYVTPQNISWAGSVTSVTGLVGEMTTYSADGRPNPTGTGYVVSGSALTSPVTGGAYSALRVAGTAGNVVTINQAGVR